jgi:1,4-alpha-glucan branching enzyme
MLHKVPVDGRPVTAVTFVLPPELGAKAAHVVGEFNDWSETATAMKPNEDGSFTATLELPNGKRFRFRYLLDGATWENDWGADAYEPNEFGGDDSVIEL